MTCVYDRNRWTYLAAATLVLICTGSIYAFSVLSGPLAALRGWTLPQAALGFTINTAMAPIPMILGGKIVDKGWARAGMAGGAMLFGVAFVITGLISSLAVFYLAYGVMGGLGVGLAYSGALGNVTRLFPDRRGLATGVLMAGNGAAALITAPLASQLIAHAGVRQAWLLMGLGFIVITAACGALTRSAPADFRPAGWAPSPSARSAAGPAADLDWRAMLGQPSFYGLLFILATGALSGLMVAANAAQIAQTMYGLTVAQAAIYVGLYSAGSATGRLGWGAISDRIGRQTALICIFALVAAMLTILIFARSVGAFAIGFIGIGLSFGGLMGVFPPLVVERFGARNFGVNYGVLFTGYSVAAFFGPRLGASIGAAHHGDFRQAFVIALSICAPGVLAAIALKILAGRSRAAPLPSSPDAARPTPGAVQ